MKIIQANKFFFPQGGADRYFLDLITELEKSGEAVRPFAMADERNRTSAWSRYFSENVDYHSGRNRWRAARRFIWNREAAADFGRLLDEEKPDIIHAHNIYHQLTPSILFEAEKRHLPVVMTLHDYKLICPDYKLFTHGHECRLCLGGNYGHCLAKDCFNSYPQSALAALESAFNISWEHNYRDTVDLFISPSCFLKDLMVEAGWDKNRITVLNNPAPAYQPQTDGRRLLYAGRLAPEKGVDILIRALKDTDAELDIAGTGPDEERLKGIVEELGLKDRISFLGHLEGEALERLKREAKAIILPSVWPENMPLIILEALAYGKLVIASRSGGIPELIEDGRTGFLFSPGNAKALAVCIQDLDRLAPAAREALAANIKAKIEPLAWPEHLRKLRAIYQDLVEKNR